MDIIKKVIFFILINTSINLFAQEQKVYEIKYTITNEGNTESSDRNKPFLQVLVNNDYSSIALETENGLENYITKFSDAPTYYFLKHAEKKYLELEYEELKDKSYEIDLSSTETKNIQNYTCQLAIIKFRIEEGEIYEFKIWYTSELPNFCFSDLLLLKKIPGAALQIFTEDYSIDAFEINKLTQPLSVFEIPKDYTLLEVDSVADYNNIGINRYYYEDETGTYFGLKDGEGNIISAPIYYGMSFFKGDISIVTNENEKYGAIDYDGKEIIPLKFDYLDYEPTSNQYIFSENSKFGIMTDDKILIPADYQLITFISNGYAIITKNNKTGIINEHNKIIVPANFDNIIDHNSTLFVNMHNNGSYTLHRINDSEQISSNYEMISLSKSDELILVCKNHKYGFINNDGEIIIPFKYTYATPFNEGHAFVYTSEDLNEFQIIDTTGKILHQGN